MIVKVEQRHIDRGIRENCEKCPIAQALFEQTGARYVSCDGDQIVIEIDGRDMIWSTPDVAAQFMTSFDAGETVKPLEFELGEQAADVEPDYEFPY